jgi:hypothetical protein
MSITDGHIASVIIFVIMTRHCFFFPSFSIVILSVVTNIKFSSVNTKANSKVIFHW